MYGVGIGLRLAPRGQSGTPVSDVLDLVGLGYLAENTTHMLYPNDPSRSAGNRHYLYEKNGGWSAAKATLSSASEKVYWSSADRSALTVFTAGSLRREGLTEPAAVNKETHPFDIAGWSYHHANLTITNGTYSLGDVSLSKIESAGAGKAINQTTTISTGTQYVLSALAKYVSGSPWIELGDLGHGDYHQCWFNLQTGACGGATNCTARIRQFIGEVWLIEMIYTPGSGTAFYPFVCSVDGDLVETLATPSVIGFGGVNCCAGEYAMSRIQSATTRAADALRFTDLGLSRSGSALIVLSLPFAGSYLASDTYVWGLNGADSLDDGVFLYAYAFDDHLYAEVRSGGIREDQVDLGLFLPDVDCSIALSWNTDGLKACVNGVEKTASGYVALPTALDRLEIGRGISSQSATGGSCSLVCLFDRELTAGERLSATGLGLITGVTGHSTEPFIVIDGDSLTEMWTGVAYAQKFPWIAAGNLTSRRQIRAGASLSGNEISDRIAAAPDGIDAYAHAGNRNNVLVFMCGTNDFAHGDSAADTYAELQAYCAARRAAGFRVIVFTVLPSTVTGGFNGLRNDYNALLAAGHSFADAYCDMAAEATIGPDAAASNAALYPDGTHPSAAAHALAAVQLLPVLQSMF
jgi:lysophospholipase L1-like esterase